MKRFGSMILTAIFGSALTVLAFVGFGLTDNGKSIKIEHISSTPAMSTSYAVDENGEMVPLEFTDVAKNVMPAVVHIRSTEMVSGSNSSSPFGDMDPFEYFFGPQYRGQAPQQQRPQMQEGIGSGVIISSDGYIVTNNHVVENADDIEVVLDDNREYKAKVVGTDPTTDLALIQIEEKDLPVLPFANSDVVEVGQWVLAVGNPFDLNSTVTAGIVSAKGRNIGINQNNFAIESFIQTDAAINPGNSGGALVNMQGGLIGINTAIASPTGAYAGYGFAIPANIVSKVVEDLIKYGTVQRGFLGITIRSVDADLAREYNLDVNQGVYVDSLVANSAAGDAGIKAGDIILEVDGTVVKTHSELIELVGRHRPGDKVDLKVDREGKEMEFQVTLRNQSGETKLVERNPVDILNILGVEVQDVDRATARKLDIPGGVKITRLYSGKLQQETEVRSGFIITKADGKAVNSEDDLVSILENKNGGVLLEGVYEDYPGTYYYAFGL